MSRSNSLHHDSKHIYSHTQRYLRTYKHRYVISLVYILEVCQLDGSYSEATCAPRGVPNTTEYKVDQGFLVVQMSYSTETRQVGELPTELALSIVQPSSMFVLVELRLDLSCQLASSSIRGKKKMLAQMKLENIYLPGLTTVVLVNQYEPVLVSIPSYGPFAMQVQWLPVYLRGKWSLGFGASRPYSHKQSWKRGRHGSD